LDLLQLIQDIHISTYFGRVRLVALAFGAMYSTVALDIHSPQLRKVRKYQRGKLGTVIICLFV